MKKTTAFLVILIFVGTASFAQFQIKPSAGFAVLGDLGFGNGKYATSTQGNKSHQLQNFNMGAGLFVDITYAEIDAYCSYGLLNYIKKESSMLYPASPPVRNIHGTALQFGFSILGKYPIEISSITLFPILGLNYNTFMFAWDWDTGRNLVDNAVKTFSQFGIQTGVGFDKDLTSRIYFRLEGLFQLRFVSKNMKAYFDTFMKGAQGTNSRAFSLPGMGPVIKAGFGFKFY